MADVAPSHPTQAKLGYTTTLERGEGTDVASATWANGDMEVTDLTPWDASRDSVEVTNHRSPGFSVEKIPGLIDWGSCSFEINFVPSHPIAQILLSDFKSAGNAPWRVVFPDGETWSFLASLTSFNVTAPVKDVMKASLELSVSGEPVLETNGATAGPGAMSITEQVPAEPFGEAA